MVLLLGLCGCRKNEFKVEFSLPDNINTTYTLIYYASDPSKGWIVEQVVPVQKGRAQGTLPTRLPALVYVMASGSTTPAAVFYAERGDDFKISGDSPDPVNWTISGNKITDRLTDWRLASKGAIEAAPRPGLGRCKAQQPRRQVCGRAPRRSGQHDSPADLLQPTRRRGWLPQGVGQPGGKGRGTKLARPGGPYRHVGLRACAGVAQADCAQVA